MKYFLPLILLLAGCATPFHGLWQNPATQVVEYRTQKLAVIVYPYASDSSAKCGKYTPGRR